MIVRCKSGSVLVTDHCYGFCVEKDDNNLGRHRVIAYNAYVSGKMWEVGHDLSKSEADDVVDQIGVALTKGALSLSPFSGES